MRCHDRVRNPRAANRGGTIVIRPSDAQVVNPPGLCLAGLAQCDVDGGEVGVCRAENGEMPEFAVGWLRTGLDLEFRAFLNDILDTVPLQTGNFEEARGMGRIATQANALKVEAEAGVVAELCEPNLRNRGSVALQHLRAGRGFILDLRRRDDLESVKDKPMIRNRNWVNVAVLPIFAVRRCLDIIKLGHSQHPSGP